MKPLIFLSYRSAVNGIRRSLKDPKRLIGLLFFIAYFGWFLGTRFLSSNSGGALGTRLRGQALEYPPVEILGSVSFFLFALLSLLFMAQAGTQRTGFRQADVDVLFATPVSTRTVYLYRLLREYLLTLVMPLLFLVLFWRSGGELWTSFFRDVPQAASPGEALRSGMIAWMLLSVAWVSMLNAVSLFTNRSDAAADRMRFRLNLAVFTLFVLTIGFVFWRLYGQLSFGAVIDLGQSVVLRIVFFTGTLGSWIVMGPLAGEWNLAAAGIAALLAITYFGYRLALTQIDWMYDQAAVRVAEAGTVSDRHRQGDLLGVAAELARRKGAKRSRREGWLHHWNMAGPWALVWKEVFLVTRGTLAILLLFGAVTIGSSFLSLLVPESRRGPQAVGMTLLIIVVCCGFATATSLSQLGFIESLRRVDLLKPLPFTPAKIAFFDILAKSVVAFLPTIPAVLPVVILRPQIWDWGFASVFAVSSLCLVICASGFLVMVLFPDIEDPTQRGIRGIVQMLAMGAMALPSALAATGLLVLKASPIVAALVGAAIALGISILCALIAGRLYADFNPSE